MNLKLSFLFVFVLGLVQLQAKEVKKNTAQVVAKNAFAYHFNKSADQVRISESVTRSFQNKGFYHVFNFEGNGYMILSAEDNYEPVIAFSDKSFIDLDLLDELDVVLAPHLRNIQLFRERNLSASKSVQQKWIAFRTEGANNKSAATLDVVVAPLTTTMWSQSDAYNESCPVGTNSRGDANNFCGCIPIAVAQLMRYWEYPSRGAGNRNYISPEGGEFINLNFCDSDNNFNNMPDSLKSDEINRDVTDFIFEVGASMETQYSTDYTGTYSEYVQEAMVYYWKYDRAMKSDEVFNPPVGWHADDVISELNLGRPCMYTANKIDEEGKTQAGHAWVADGYAYGPNVNGAGNSSLYVHYNLGWRFGNSTGYYLDNDFNWLLENNGGLDPINFFSGFYFSRWLFWNIKPGSDKNAADPSQEKCQPPKPDFVDLQVGDSYAYILYNNERPFTPREVFFLEIAPEGSDDWQWVGDNINPDGSNSYYIFANSLTKGVTYNIRISRECCLGDERDYSYGSFTAGEPNSGVMEGLVSEDDFEGEEEEPQCGSEVEGTIFFETCDDQSFFLVRTDDGSVYDPYFQGTVSPADGARMKFTFKTNTTNISCVDEDIPNFVSPIDICTFEFIEGPEEDDLFDLYPWLADACIPGATITLHTYTPNPFWNFLLVNHNDGNGTYSMYLQNGTFYGTGTESGGVFEYFGDYIDVNAPLDSVTCP